MTPFEKAYAEARRKWERGESGPTFSYEDKKYSVTNREEAARQKEMAQSPMRGRGYGGRAEAPAPAPAPRARASASDIPGLIARGMAKGAEHVPSGRGLGAAFTAAGAANAVGRAAQAAAAAKAAPAAKRVEPLMYTSRGEKGKFVPSSAPKGGAKVPERQEPPMYKKGGLVTKAKRRG